MSVYLLRNYMIETIGNIWKDEKCYSTYDLEMKYINIFEELTKEMENMDKKDENTKSI